MFGSHCARSSYGAAALLGIGLVIASAGPLRAQTSETMDPDAAALDSPAAPNSAAAPLPALTLDRFWPIQPPGHVAPLKLGALFSVDAYVGPERATDADAGFDVTDARIAVRGELEEGFGYFVQAILIQSRPLLDAIIDWQSPDHGFRIGAGYFRSPFSAELLIPAPRLDFVERSQIVRALAPSRQIGVQIDQQLLGEGLVAHVGVFNGNGLSANDDERFLYILRLDGKAETGSGASTSAFEYGVNGAYSEDDDADLGLGLPRGFAGKRWLAGVDARWTQGPVFVSAEGIYASIDPNGASNRNVYGYQASLGWTVNSLVQVLARYDAIYAASLQEDRDLAIASLVLNFTEYISLQTELRIPTRGEGPTPGGVMNLNLTF